VALIGVGSMGRNHARVVQQSQHSQLTSIIDTDENLGRKAAETFNSRWLPDLADFSNIDYAIIATPTEHHFDIALSAINSGVPVLIEKPVTESLAKTTEILNLAKKLDIPVACGFVERFNPAILTLEKILGDVRTIQTIRHSPKTPRIKNSVASDLLIHDLDLVLNILKASPVGLSKSVYQSHVGAPSSLDAVDVILQFEGSKIANLSASRISHRKIRTMSVIEIDRLIEVDLLRRDITIYKHIEESASADGIGYRQQTIIEIPSLITNEEPLSAQLNSFISLINSKNSSLYEQESRRIIASHDLLSRIES
jgi:predicted dehydrogenase